jgi:hypothetical protein
MALFILVQVTSRIGPVYERPVVRQVPKKLNGDSSGRSSIEESRKCSELYSRGFIFWNHYPRAKS